MPAVTMFSVVEVGHGDDERFIQFYKEVRDFLSKQPGFIMNQLFRSGAQTAARRFMVVGKWESTEAMASATTSEEWKKLMSGRQMTLSPTPFEEVIVD